MVGLGLEIVCERWGKGVALWASAVGRLWERLWCTQCAVVWAEKLFALEVARKKAPDKLGARYLESVEDCGVGTLLFVCWG